jgi:MATE family multidrug resistance protein
VLGASFFIADGVQTIAAGSLRGLNDTRVPLAFAAISFWLVGFSGCWLFGFTLRPRRLRHLDRAFARHRGLCVLLIWRFQRSPRGSIFRDHERRA